MKHRKQIWPQEKKQKAEVSENKESRAFRMENK